MQSHVYILFSGSLDKYYVGFTTLSPEERLERHLNNFYNQKKKFTKAAADWQLFWTLPCNSEIQAMKIESHIKKMKSKTYIENLVKYSEISSRLLAQYQ